MKIIRYVEQMLWMKKIFQSETAKYFLTMENHDFLTYVAKKGHFRWVRNMNFKEDVNRKNWDRAHFFAPGRRQEQGRNWVCRTCLASEKNSRLRSKNGPKHVRVV